MKTFSILTFLSLCLAFSLQAQDQTYVPNARQAIQKSRMQQPQYLDLTKDQTDKQQESAQVTSDPKSNYQIERPVAIDAPKRRGKKSGESTFKKLASISKR